jgi:hypothetical protein
MERRLSLKEYPTMSSGKSSSSIYLPNLTLSTRHKFVDVSYVGLQYRNERKVLNSPEAVQFLRRSGPLLIQKYGGKNGISLHDLIVGEYQNVLN